MVFDRAIRSVIAHTQNWQSRHFELTRYGRSIAKLKDSHKGEKCFVIGNGPSLSAADLQVLHEHGIPCFGSNRIFRIFDQTDWRPTYFASEDVIILRGIQREVEAIPAEKKFIPVNLKWYEGIDIQGADYFYLMYHGDLGDTFFEVLKGNVGIYTDYKTADEQKLTEIGVGHIFGELALFDTLPRSATAVALDEVTVNEVSADDVQGYFNDDPEKISFIIKELGERIIRLNSNYEDACDTIRDVFPDDGSKKPGILDKIKQFAAE